MPGVGCQDDPGEVGVLLDWGASFQVSFYFAGKLILQVVVYKEGPEPIFAEGFY